MLRFFAIGALIALAQTAAAQDWATKEVCTVDIPKVYEDAFLSETEAQLEQKANAIPNGHGRFWEIVHPSGATSYLWGTFHSSDPNILRLADTVAEEIKSARIVAVEIDFTAKSRADYRASQYIEGRYKEATDAFSIADPGDGKIAGLPLEISGWVIDRAIELGWTEDADLILSRAGMAEMLLSDPCEDFSTGILPLQDDYIQLLGRLGGAEILGLEEPNAFFEDLKNQPETADAITAVYAAYLKPENTNHSRSTAIKLYSEGRIGTMMAWDQSFLTTVLGNRASGALEATDNYLVDFRNERFLSVLQEELPKGGVFIAVGAFHLPGKQGLIELLRAKGYKVARIPQPDEIR